MKDKYIAMIVKVWNDQFEFSEFFYDFDRSDLPEMLECPIDSIPQDHYCYGWLECLFQSDNAPMWEPEHISLTFRIK